MASGLRLTPTRFFIPVSAKGGFVDLMLDDACPIREVRERIVLEARRSSLTVDNFVLSADEKGKLVFTQDKLAFLDPKHELPFDVSSGKLLAYVRILAPEPEEEAFVNFYKIPLPPKSKRRDIPLPEESGASIPELPDRERRRSSRLGEKESIYHALRKSRGLSARKSKDEEFDTLEAHLRGLLTYLEGLKRQVTSFQTTLRALCLGTKEIT